MNMMNDTTQLEAAGWTMLEPSINKKRLEHYIIIMKLPAKQIIMNDV
jgi:hypothetical protein